MWKYTYNLIFILLYVRVHDRMFNSSVHYVTFVNNNNNNNLIFFVENIKLLIQNKGLRVSLTFWGMVVKKSLTAVQIWRIVIRHDILIKGRENSKPEHQWRERKTFGSNPCVQSLRRFSPSTLVRDPGLPSLLHGGRSNPRSPSSDRSPSLR